MQDQVQALLRNQLADIIPGSVFLFFGLAACSIAAIRRHSGVRVLLWLGIWSAMYGTGLLSRSAAVVAALPHAAQGWPPYLNTAIAYLTVVVGLFAFLELSVGGFRIVIKMLVFAGIAVAVAGIGWFVATGSEDKFISLNTIVAVTGLCILTAVVSIKKLSARFMVMLNRGVLAFGTLVFAIEGLWTNVSRSLGSRTPRLVDHLAFAVFLLSFAYVAVERALTNERRLLAIENELDLARQLQFSILPETVPDAANLRIAATYRPMTAVAGDFYEFIAVDRKKVGFLVADVSGHGVPAALIASMIKVAAQSVEPCAHDPQAVLRELSRVLSAQLRGQLVSAAYLWVDTEASQAQYSAAGHPPLLRWRQGRLQRIESNGLPFGVMLEANDYPVCTLPIGPGDRFLLYTDGVTEPENASGIPFGDDQLEQVIRGNQGRSPAELSDEILVAIRQWQPPSVTQQDDITLIVIDVV